MTAINPPDNETSSEQPLVSHLLELRDRLLRMLVAVFVVFLALFPFANDIYVLVAEPLMRHLPEGTSMIATEVASPFLTPFKLSLVSAAFIAMPFLLYQLWAFIAPGLYRHEKRLAMPLLASSIVLFYVGMAFAYYVVFPLVFAFLTGTAPEGVAVMTDISRYLDFVLRLFFAFGLAFEVPIATILLVSMGMTTPDKLAEKRPYIIVGAFVIGMLLTPPDIISQTLLAFPMWVLFELGIILSRLIVRKRTEQEETQVAPAYATGAATTKVRETAAETSTDPVAKPTREAAPFGKEIAAGDMDEEGRFVPLTKEEMEQELDAIERAEEEQDAVGAHEGQVDDDEEPAVEDPVDQKLQQVQSLRDNEDEEQARRLLYEVLEEGNENQRQVARNILSQLDSD